MKKILLLFAILLSGMPGLTAQITVTGDISTNTTWTNNNIYILTGGFVYVTGNAVLTIEPGTIIKGNASTLVITRGAKIIAEGTQTQPIVFTSFQPAGSRNPGDWGGVIICGKAPINDPAGQRLAEGGIDATKGLYGGTDPNDNSGILRYVRIEYAGIAYLPNNETNGLTLGAVGMGTTIDYVQVSHGGDDSFEWFGGTVNCRHLISKAALDDNFDTDYGFVGKIQFAVVLSDSATADVSQSNGFESDNDATGTTNAPLTHPIFSNISFYGPKRTSSTVVNSLHRNGAHIRRSSALCTYNSIFAGFPVGLKLDGTNTATNAKNNSLQYKNNIIAGSPQTFDTASFSITWTPGYSSFMNWFNTNMNTVLPNVADIMAADAYNYTNPDFLLQPGSPALTGASFSSPNLTDPFFSPTAYRGAFDGSNDWTSCWSNFDPQNTNYDTPGINYLAVNVSAGGPITFCTGDSVTLTSDAVSGNVWNTSATTNSINVTSSGSYYVTVTSPSGCMATSPPVNVIVNPQPVPVVTAGGPTTFCTGDSVILSTGAYSAYSWSSGDTTSSAVISTTGNHSVTVTDANGCAGTSTLTSITVNPAPSAPVISAAGPTSFCTGGSVDLTTNNPSGNSWSTAETTQTITVTSSGIYSVTYTDANGCSAVSAPLTVNVSSAPLPTVMVTGSISLCAGETVTLTSSPSDSYSWSPGGQTTQTITVSAAGTYAVTTTNTDPCNGVGTSDAILVTVNPVPVASGAVSSMTGFNVTFSNTSTGATSYEWDFGDLSSSAATTPTHAYTSNGTYTVTLIAKTASCSDTVTFNVTLTVGVEEKQNFQGLNLYPNPVSQEATISLELIEPVEMVVVITDMTGKTVVNVFTGEMSAGSASLTVDVSELPPGIYFTTITARDFRKTLKMVVQK